MMKVILKINEKDLDSMLKEFFKLEIREIKIKRIAKNKNMRQVPISTYNEPDK